MKASEELRKHIVAELETHQQMGWWIEIRSEIHGNGNQALFFFLVSSPESIGEIVTLFRDITADELIRCDETEFELSFSEIRGDRKIIWDVVVDSELRGNMNLLANRVWGDKPVEFALCDDELFQ